MTRTLYLETPEDFDFQRTVLSHGWYQLLPFEFDTENRRLSFVFTDGEKPISAVIRESVGKLEIETSDGEIGKDKILRSVRRVLRFDDDLSEFYKLTKKDFAWIAQTRTGRMLRSPTVFEDLVKTVCTTNCSWALTKNMTKNLVEKLGAESADGKKAFPTAARMANQAVEFYKNEIRAGYRAPYLVELAESVAAGKINPENWLHSDLPTGELKKQMKQIKGVGDYAAENLLKLVGRYDGLALDSYLRAQFYKKRGGETVCGDKEIEKFYDAFGSWRGLVMWCDMSEK